jgi:hypothetical protein
MPVLCILQQFLRGWHPVFYAALQSRSRCPGRPEQNRDRRPRLHARIHRDDEAGAADA